MEIRILFKASLQCWTSLRLSGLTINPAKSSIYMAGRVSQAFRDEVSSMGIPVDTLPVRYLGLPLMTKSMPRDDYRRLKAYAVRSYGLDHQTQIPEQKSHGRMFVNQKMKEVSASGIW